MNASETILVPTGNQNSTSMQIQHFNVVSSSLALDTLSMTVLSSLGSTFLVISDLLKGHLWLHGEGNPVNRGSNVVSKSSQIGQEILPKWVKDYRQACGLHVPV